MRKAADQAAGYQAQAIRDETRQRIDEWLARQKVADEQQLFEDYRYFRIQYHPIPNADGARLALVNPPGASLGFGIRDPPS